MANPPQVATSNFDNLARQFEVITHNLANVSTSGYKRRRMGFAEVLAGQAGGTGGAKTIEGKVSTDFTQGALVRTDRPFDAALDGDGFFVIETPQGPRLTRNGAFRLNTNRQIVDSRGRPVAGEGGPITIPPSVAPEDVRIAPDGTVSAGGEQVGKLRITGFEDPSVLTPAGEGNFVAGDDAQEATDVSARVVQGHREASNVSLVEEMVGMITVTRLYEAQLKAIASRGDRMESILRVAMS